MNSTNPMNPTNPMNSMNSTNPTNPKIAILGAGGWGKNHVRVFSNLLGEDRVLVCDVSPDCREAIQRAHPKVKVCAELNYSLVDAVVIATPAGSHAELAKQALNEGKDVLVEKPLTLSVGDAQMLVDLAEQCQRILMVDHLLEYHPAIVRLKSLLDDGTLGRIRHMTSQRLNLGVIRSEENAWWSLAPHDVSIALHLMNEQPIEVSAIGGTYLQDGIPDVVHATLRFDDGAVAHIHVSWLDPVKTRRMTIVGSKAMAVFDDMSDDKLVLRTDEIRKQDGRYLIDNAPQAVEELPDSEPLRSMAESFLENVRSGVPPRSDGWDGLRVVRVLEAVQQSLDTGGKIVRMEDYDA